MESEDRAALLAAKKASLPEQDDSTILAPPPGVVLKDSANHQLGKSMILSLSQSLINTRYCRNHMIN